MTFKRINNSLIDPDKITCAYQDPENINRITVVFDNGFTLVFTGAEAVELWALLDPDKGWRNE